MSKFLFIPRPLHEESPTSLLKRMAIKHGCVSYSDIQILFGRSDLSSSLICRTHPIIQSIAKRAGAAGQVFLSGFYEPIGPLRDVPPLQIAGLTVHPDMIRKKGTGFCSECWKGGHEYFMKDLKFSSYCPYHFRKYLTNCPHCNLTLRWHTPIGEICRCKNLLISPPCSSEEAEIEQKLLSIFRAGDAETFRHLIVCLNKLDYRIESDDQCPANRCRMSIAFALLEGDMGSLMYLLRQMSSLYPKTPKRIIAAMLSLFHDEYVKICAHTFIKLSPDTPNSEIKYFSTTPIHDFSLTRPQLSAWLKISAHYWQILNRLSNIRPEKARYNWKQAQNISKEVLATKLTNGFRKKKTVITGISTKELQEKLNLSPATIKRAIDEHILTPSRFKYRIIFDESDVEAFSKKYISLQLLSSQILTPTKLIRKTINRLKIAPLNFKSRTLRSQIISVETSELITYWYHTNGQSSMKPPQCLSPFLGHHAANHTEKWLSTATAAAYLGICASIVRYLIRFGILVNARRSGAGGGYCIEKKVLDEFISRYISATDARK